MSYSIENRNIVILSKGLAPTRLSREKLIQNGIVVAEEEIVDSIFAENLCQVITSNFNLLVLPHQIQFTITSDNNINLSLTKLNKIVELFSEYHFIALGINFIYGISSENNDQMAKSNFIFSKPSESVYAHFQTEDSKFGGYMSRDFNNSRLKLHISPTKQIRYNSASIVESVSDEYLQFSFNFHIDLNTSNNTLQLKDSISNWNLFSDFSKEVVNSY